MKTKTIDDVVDERFVLEPVKCLAMPDLLLAVIADIEARRQAVKEQEMAPVGLGTGLPKLDRLLGGLQPGLHLLAAEPGQEKTMFTLQVASYVAECGWPVLFVSFEEALPRLALKAICAKAYLDVKWYSDGHGDPSVVEWAACNHVLKLAALYFIEGTGRLTVPQVKAKALQVMNKRKASMCLVVVDYLQRWAAGRREFSEFRHAALSLVSELRELAFRIDSPIIVGSSLNRPGQGTANWTSLEESGALEYSADTALFLVESQKRQATPRARAVDLVVEKNRYGDKGAVELIFYPETGKFLEVE